MIYEVIHICGCYIGTLYQESIFHSSVKNTLRCSLLLLFVLVKSLFFIALFGSISIDRKQINKLSFFVEMARFTVISKRLFLLLDVETTGSSNEFYDKFGIRYHISVIMKGIWKRPIHKASIIQESRFDGFVS